MGAALAAVLLENRQNVIQLFLADCLILFAGVGVKVEDADDHLLARR
jgi:hypothetical protein